MRLHPRVIAAVLALAAAPAADGATPAEVDPFIGVDGYGNVTPGAQVPFGFAAPGPDTRRPRTSGYRSGQPVRGFSQTHVSGTGGAGKYGNFRVTPMLGRFRLNPPARPLLAERASPGYYAATLAGPIRAELTAGRLAAYHRYRFPRRRPAWLVIDAASVLRLTSQHQRVQRAWVRRTGSRSLTGGARVAGGWGLGRYRLYFAAVLDRRPRTLRVAAGGRKAYAGFGRTRGATAVRIGLSFRSARRARAHLRHDLRGGFARVRARATKAWARVLGRVTVSGGSDAERRIFATALYHAHLMPHDLSGENAWWRSRAPHYEDLYAVWDTFRTVNPLLALIEPDREAAIVRSLLDSARNTGWLPDGRVAGNDGLTQVGSNGEVVVADAIVKGLPGVERSAAYRVVSRDADVSSPHPATRGRRLDAYRRLGFVPLGERASASRTLEYAYEDFTAAEVAYTAGHPRAAGRYLLRSRSWRNLWDQSTRYVRPRHAAGAFMAGFDPNRFYGDWRDPFYEGTSTQWSTFVPHDAAGLIARVGGDGAMLAWLGRLFAARERVRNEVDLLAPYLYTHAGRPDLAAREVRDQRERGYSTSRDGVPGNDDAGTLSAWYVWNAIGLYPNAGQPFYYVGAPLFESARVALPGGRAFTVVRHGPPDGVVVAAALDGRPLDRAWLTHAEIVRGGLLDLVMGPVPSGWGTGSRPPSPAS